MLILTAEDTDTQTQAINIVHLIHLLSTDSVSYYSKGEEGGEGTRKKKVSSSKPGWLFGEKGKKTQTKPTYQNKGKINELMS